MIRYKLLKATIIAIIIVFIITVVSIIIVGKMFEHKEPKIKPCEPLSIHQSILYVEKRQMFLNQIANANKKNKPSLQDSARKYTKLLMNCDSAKFNEDMFKTEEL